MLSRGPLFSKHERPHHVPLLVTGMLVGSVCWLIMLVATRFNLFTVSVGLAVMLYVTGER
jgi:hypothetical protein